MNEPARNVLPKMQLLSENDYCRFVGEIIGQIKRERGIKNGDIADRLHVDEKTIKNAAAGDHKLNALTLINLLAVSPTALELFLHYFDRRSVPLGAKCDTDVLTSVSGALHHLALAAAHSGPNDTDCLQMETALDAAIEGLCSLKSRCLTIREKRA